MYTIHISLELCSAAESYVSCTYGFSGGHRPDPKARQAAARLAVSGHLCHVGLFTDGTRHLGMGLVDRMGAVCELGACPARACPAHRSRRPASCFGSSSHFRPVTMLTNDRRSVFPASNCHLGAFGSPGGFSAPAARRPLGSAGGGRPGTARWLCRPQMIVPMQCHAGMPVKCPQLRWQGCGSGPRSSRLPGGSPLPRAVHGTAHWWGRAPILV